MARAIWKGSISFGLVSIPIELHTAVRDTRPHVRVLHATDKRSRGREDRRAKAPRRVTSSRASGDSR